MEIMNFCTILKWFKCDFFLRKEPLFYDIFFLKMPCHSPWGDGSCPNARAHFQPNNFSWLFQVPCGSQRRKTFFSFWFLWLHSLLAICICRFKWWGYMPKCVSICIYMWKVESTFPCPQLSHQRKWQNMKKSGVLHMEFSKGRAVLEHF